MFRIIGGVVLGLVTLIVVTVFAFLGFFLGIGTDRTFQPGSFEVTPLWIAGGFVLNIVAAFLAGKICAIVTENSRAVLALAALVLVLGLWSAFNVPANRPTVRTGVVSLAESMVNAREPTWFLISIPVISAVAVWLGGRNTQKTLRIKA